jgi:hypothetical protein
MVALKRQVVGLEEFIPGSICVNGLGRKLETFEGSGT